MRETLWGRHVIHGRWAYLGRSAANIRWAFPGHALIASLGLRGGDQPPGRVRRPPARDREPADAEGAYEERHLKLVRPLAALLVPGFLSGLSAGRS